jgi:putative DNA primase/helicase
VGDWSTGEIWHAFPDKEESLSVEEAAERRGLINEARSREKQQREDNWHDIAQKVRSRLNVLERGRNAYLDKKGIQGEFLIDGENIVVPLSDIHGDVWTVQTINPEGNKRLFTGGKKKGCFHRFGNIGDVIYVCEGFATAWSVHYSTNECAIMAVDVHNMKPVVDSLVIKYGKDKVVVCADNDGGPKGGIGVEKAKELESKYGVRIAIPTGEGDFNDVHQKDGPKAVRDMLSTVSNLETFGGIYELPPTKDLGLVGEIADWITSTAIRKQPTLSIAAALAFVGMAKGHKVQTESGLRTNVLVLSVGQSTSGKDYPRKAIQHLASYCGLADYMKGDPASDTSIIDGVFGCGGKQLMQIDEMGKLLNSLGGKNASSHQSGIVPTIMKMFSSADTIYHGKQYCQIVTGKHQSA